MTIDERLEFLVKSTESLHETAQKTTDQIAGLKAISDRHEAEIQRFRRAMRGALEAWLGGNNGEEGAP